jgi:hypothetical protein
MLRETPDRTAEGWALAKTLPATVEEMDAWNEWQTVQLIVHGYRKYSKEK